MANNLAGFLLKLEFHRAILGPLLFLIYMNDLPDRLNSIAKLIADDTSLYSIVHNPNESAKHLNLGLSVVS